MIHTFHDSVLHVHVCVIFIQMFVFSDKSTKEKHEILDFSISGTTYEPMGEV